MKFLCTCALSFSLLQSITSWSQAGEQIESRLPRMNKGDWSLVIMPDTQIYSRSKRLMSTFNFAMQWVELNRESRNIKAVLQVGDIVDNNLHYQFKNITNSLKSNLQSVPFFFAQGNHDVGIGGTALTRDTLYNKYFQPSISPLNEKAYGGSFASGEFENSYYLLKSEKQNFLILLLEFSPRDEVIAWANEIVARYPRHKAILVVHEYMDEISRISARDGIPTRSTASTPGSAHKYSVLPKNGRYFSKNSKNSGEDLWQKLISKHSNFEFVFSGHHSDFDDSAAPQLKTGDGAAKSYRSDDIKSKKGISRVHQFMFDSQWIENGGDAWMLVLQFSADGSYAKAQTYSPLAQHYPQYVTAPQVYAESWNLNRNPGKLFDLLKIDLGIFRDLF